MSIYKINERSNHSLHSNSKHNQVSSFAIAVFTSPL